MAERFAESNNSGDELWDMAFSNVGRAYDKPMKEEEIIEAIQAISGLKSTWKTPQRPPRKVTKHLVGNSTVDTSHALQSQLYMNPPPSEQQEDFGKQYDFVLYDPQEACNDAAEDTIPSGTDGVVTGLPSYPGKLRGIPGRRGHLVPGSSRPWRVKKQP
jgi:hypothetical protein